jgi:Fe-S cluster assembly ATP-binding protein
VVILKKAIMLKITNLTVLFNEIPILQDISLEVLPGATHALMGPNGSGKSTLAATLMGNPVYHVAAGSVIFQGQNLLDLSIEKRARSGIFLAYQNPPAIAGVSIFTFLKEAHRMLTGTSLTTTEFQALIYRAFDDVHLDHSFVYRSVHEGFSGGEKKRFEAAQILLFKPQLAILDELDSGLDQDALHHVSQALKNAQTQTGMALLIITHQTRFLKYLHPEMIHVLFKGKLRLSSDSAIAHLIESRGYDELFI